MKRGASLINTARGALIREDDLVEVLAERPDLTAVLDVTEPEPPAPDSALRRLPNIVLTPHIAGAFNGECRRLGEMMVTELRRFLDGKALQHEIREQDMRLRA
jgi:phosphoglycerate dehydrogenase-like enzyme